MQSPFDNSSDFERRSNDSLDCAALMDAATPLLFQKNAFRITGLSVDASPRDVARHADKLKMMAELGALDTLPTGAYALNPQPTEDDIRDALHRLKDPEKRVIDEFFWFWPCKFGKSEHDEALKSLNTGNRAAALKYWAAKETDPFEGVVAMHNIAIFWHLAALEHEAHESRFSLSVEDRLELEGYWKNAFKRWELLADDDALWEIVAERCRQLDDARLTTGFLRRMRSSLPEAFDKINGLLAIRCSENGDFGGARFHVRLMRETHSDLDDVEKTSKQVLKPVKARLEAQIDSAKTRAATSPTEALNLAHELLEHAKQARSLFDLFFGKDSHIRNDLLDEVAEACVQLAISYHKVAENNKACLELMRKALAFATAIDLRRRIDTNINTLTGNIAGEKVTPIYLLLKEIQESSQTPKASLERVRNSVIPLLNSMSPGSNADVVLKELHDNIAVVLRGIAIDAWNDHQDKTTAVNAARLGIEIVRDGEFKQQLLQDLNTLSAMQTPSQNAATGCLAQIGGYILVFVFIGVFGAIMDGCN